MEARELLSIIRSSHKQHAEHSKGYTAMRKSEHDLYWKQNDSIENALRKLYCEDWIDFDLNDITFLAGMYNKYRCVALHNVLRKIANPNE